MIRFPSLLALPLGLAACTAIPPQTPGAQPESYMALGTEPGWTLEITPGLLNYTGDYGDTKILEPNPGARPGFNGERYTGKRLAVDITHAECSDGMSERRYRDTVTVSADGKTVKGCGGGILAPEALAGTSWTFVSIGGVSVAGGRVASLAFEETRLSGSAGCNRFSGTYTSDGTTLRAGPLMATKMACPGAAMTQESSFFALLAGPVRLEFPSDGTLILTGADGQSAVLKRAI